MSKPKHTPGATYVSVEAVIQGSSEDPIEFKCRSEKQAMRLRSTLAAAPEMLEALETCTRDVEHAAFVARQNGNMTLADEYDKTARKSRRTIAKATGAE